MKIAVFQPYLFPYVGYFQLIEKVDKFVIFDNVAYRKKSYVNRNYFLVNKRIQRITFPVSKISQNRYIDQHQYSQQFKEVLSHLKPKKVALQKLIRNILKAYLINQSVAKVNTRGLIEIIKILGFNDVEFLCSSDLFPDWAKVGVETGEEKILKICEKLQAWSFVTPRSGARLYSEKVFNRAGIELLFFENSLCETMDNWEKPLSIFSLLEIFGPEVISSYVKLGKYFPPN